MGHKLRAMNEVVDILSSPSWSTVNAAVANNNEQQRQRKDIVTDYLLKQRHIHEFSVTGTPKPATTNLNDIFITVKTTKLYHDTRLALIIKTWFQLAKDQVSFILFNFYFPPARHSYCVFPFAPPSIRFLITIIAFAKCSAALIYFKTPS